MQFLDAQYHSQSKLEPPIEHLALAEISLTNETADGLFVGVNIEGKGVALAVRSRYVLRQRSYDKNTSRIVSALGLIDAEKPHPQDPPLGVLVVRSAQDQESWGRRAPEPGLHSNLDILSAAKRLATLYTTLRVVFLSFFFFFISAIEFSFQGPRIRSRRRQAVRPRRSDDCS